jgi:L-lactate dehydrogenase (cytochrome)
MSPTPDNSTNYPFANYQFEIYNQGLAGILPQIPIPFTELEQRAREKLDPGAFDYVAGGAGAEQTMRSNREAFGRWRIIPRMLRNVESRNLRLNLLGFDMPAPLLTAPVGVLSIIHPEAELAVARATASLGLTMLLSTVSSYTMEEVSRAATTTGTFRGWFQLYWPKNRDFVSSLLHRAEQAGYSALVVTLDSKLLGWRPRDLTGSYLPFLRGAGLANYISDPIFCAGLKRPPAEDMPSAISYWTQLFSEPNITWDDLKFLRAQTRLPILLKGILHADDARRAADLGMDAIVVSNHGGRQVDGAVAALDCLPGAVAGAHKMPVLFDSGIRNGADIVKALALGAKAVLIGRPYVYGLALAGESGVNAVLRGLLAELDLTMALCGIRDLDGLTPELLEKVQ